MAFNVPYSNRTDGPPGKRPLLTHFWLTFCSLFAHFWLTFGSRFGSLSSGFAALLAHLLLSRLLGCKYGTMFEPPWPQ